MGKYIRRKIRRLQGRTPEWVQLEDYESGTTSVWSSIPRAVYQTGPSRDLHPLHHREVMAFRAQNQGLSHYFFDDSQMASYMREHWSHRPIYDIFLRSLVPQMKADIFRYCVVFHHGGYYLDINKSISGSITSLHSQTSRGLISFERNEATIFPRPHIAERLLHPDKTVLQWAFGFTPRHPVLAMVIDSIEQSDSYFCGNIRHVRNAVVMFTGPGVFTAAVREYADFGEMDSVSQAGIDFWGKGTFRVRGSNIVPSSRTHYTKLTDVPILINPAEDGVHDC